MPRDQVLAFVVVLVLVSGSVVLAVIDESSRPAFADLTKIAVGAYLGGQLVPHGK